MSKPLNLQRFPIDSILPREIKYCNPELLSHPHPHNIEAMTAASIQSMSPELQTQIMRNVDSLSTLYSLLRASPRFYQVFRSRKEYLLTQIAFQQFNPHVIDDAWNLTKASQLPQPPDRVM